MATDVELSPKRHITDFFKKPQIMQDPTAKNEKRVAKGILDFFTSSRSPAPMDKALDQTEPLIVEDSAGTADQNDIINKKKREPSSADDIKEETGLKSKSKDCTDVNEKEQSLEKSALLGSNTEAADSAPTPNERCETKKSVIKVKTKRLSTKKKEKGRKADEQAFAVEERKPETKDQEKDKAESTPQQMDYAEFMKTFGQNGTGSETESPSTKSENDTVRECQDKQTVQEINHKDKSVKGRNQPLDKVNKHDKSDDQGISPTSDKGKHAKTVNAASGKTISLKDTCHTPSQKKEQYKSNKGSSGASNAFSLLMQARKEQPKQNTLGNDLNIETAESEVAEVDEDETESTDPVDHLSLQKTPSCSTPSVMNFFSKCEKPIQDKTKSTDGGGPVVVEVDIHCDPAKQKTAQRKIKGNSSRNTKSEKCATMDTVNEIVILGSEIINVEEECSKDKLRQKAKKVSALNLSPKPEEETLKSSKSTKEETSSIEISAKAESLVSPAVAAKRKQFLQDSTPTSDTNVKRAQATLQFGKGGDLAMNTSIIAKSAKTSVTKRKTEDDAEGESVPSTTGVSLKTTRTRKRVVRQISSDEESEKESSFCGQATECSIEGGDGTARSKEQQKKKQTRLRKPLESGSGSDFTPGRSTKRVLTGKSPKSRAQELLQKARKQKIKKSQKDCTGRAQKILKQKGKDKKKASAVTVKPAEEEVIDVETSSPPDDGCRRSSRRLAGLQKAKAEEERQNFISVDSDCSASSDEASTPRKRKSKKLSSPKKKPAGKLAPIFSKKKPGEAAITIPEEPPEDPELVRKRRAFLMSGVPTELKRQAVSAAPVIMASEFAPFPDISHVQQRTSSAASSGLDVWSLAVPEEIRARWKKSEREEEVKVPEMRWERLQWQSTPRGLCGSSFCFQGFSFPTVTPETQKTLLKELLQTNPTFPFSVLMDKFRSQLNQTCVDAKQGLATEKRKTSSDSDVIIVDVQTDTSATQSDRDSQWPEVLQPKSSSEMVGNESCTRRLRHWLEEWRALIQREARLSARAASRGSRSGGGDGDDSSDFDFSEDDSDCEGSGLCNTVLLLGPHGVGKTATVYALAQQLNFKVFEVNASSSRQGRHILAQLQEATQSHQVGQKKDGVVLSPPPPLTVAASLASSQPPEPAEGKKAAKKAETPVPTAFANFFKPGGAPDGKKAGVKGNPAKESKKGKGAPKPSNAATNKPSSEKATPRKRKGSVDQDVKGVSPKKRRGDKKTDKVAALKETAVIEGEEINLAGCLNLTSTSLILFDEVDLVFEEDSGFLQTVLHFINTTKIPIVMTTSDPGFQRLINARFETLVFKQPPLAAVTSQLQAVCVAAGMRVCSQDVGALAAACRGDLRQALLTLQFLALSGGGRSQEPRPVLADDAAGKTNTAQQQALKKRVESGDKHQLAKKAHSSDSDGDFVCLKPARKKVRMRIVDDIESSGETAASAVKGGDGDPAGGVVAAAADTLPAVHLLLYQSVLGVSCHLPAVFSQCMKDDYNGATIQQLAAECQKLKCHGLDLLSTNLLQLLPLPKTVMPAKWCRPAVPSSSSSCKAVKRKRIRSDIYDSECSDEEEPKPSETLLTDAKCLTAAGESKCGGEENNTGGENKSNGGETTAVASQQGSEKEALELNPDDGGENALKKTQKDSAESALPASQKQSDKKTSEKSLQENAKKGQLSAREMKRLLKEVAVKEETLAERRENGSDKEAAAPKDRKAGEGRMEVGASGSSLNNSGEADQKAQAVLKNEPPAKSLTATKPEEMKKTLRASQKSTDGGLGCRLLSSWADYYESCSAADTGLPDDKRLAFPLPLGDRGSLLPGIQDLASKEEDADNASRRLGDGIRMDQGVRSSRLLWQAVDGLVSSWKRENHSDILPDGCSLPVACPGTPSAELVFMLDAETPSVPENYRAVANAVISSLPMTSFSNLDPITLDYLPTLRAISQAEQCRQIAKAKRRFHHYFDSSSLCLSENTRTALCAEFPTK